MGVIGFSAATSTLTSLLQTYDTANAKLQEKVTLLMRIKKDYSLPPELFIRVKKSLSYQFSNDNEDVTSFLECLPPGLKIEVSLFIHESTYKTVVFLKS